ncbi:MAG: preprotein translocase subunit SecG [Planctomycetaceae bacterium]
MADFFLGALAVLLFLLSLFLVFIIMIQRGKGGGIAGSLTGTAQSAFGARGGDLLMWWTIGITAVWIFLSGVTIFFYSSPAGDVAEEQGGVEEVDQSNDTDNSTTPGVSTADAINSLINSTDADEDISEDSVDQVDVDAEDVNADEASVEPKAENGEASTDAPQNESSEE